MKRYLCQFLMLAALAVWSSYPVQAEGPSADIGHSRAPLFFTKEKIVFTLNTDFLELWKHRAVANAEVPEDIREFEASGRLVWTDTEGKHDLPVLVQLRGNTSQAESQCPFPKMSLSFEKDRATDERVSKGTLFDGLKSIGIGTHCGGKPGFSPRFGRVWGGLSPHREALIYKAQALLSIPGFEVFPTNFNYIDSNTGRGPLEPQPSGFAVNQPMPGFFLEDIKTFVKKADGKEIRAADAPFQDTDPDKLYIFTSVVDAQNDARTAGLEIEAIDPKDVIRILLFQALVGNRDWKLRISPDDATSRGLWNMKVVEADGQWIMFPYDYDLAGWVRSDSSRSRLPSFDDPYFKSSDISRVVAEFEEKRSDIEALADSLAQEDRNGARSIREQIRSFYDALAREFR